MNRARLLSSALVLGMTVALLAAPAPASADRPIGGSFPIRVEPEMEVNPAIAYNSQAQEYLVVFWNDRPGNDDIRAERVSKSGQLLGGRWIAAGAGAERRHPYVAYNSKRNQYLVVWVEESGPNSLVQSLRLSANLTPQPEGVQTLQTDHMAIGESSNPAVAYSSSSDRYLVVWEYYFHPVWPGVTSIRGRGIGFNGLTDPPAFDISVDPGGQQRTRPDLAYNRHANGFLVVWEQWDGTATADIYGRLVNGDVTMPPSLQPRKLHDDPTKNCTAPAVAAIPTAPGAYKYLVVWQSEFSPGDWDIGGRLVAEDGTPHAISAYIANTPGHELKPAVAGTEDGYRYLVIWAGFTQSGARRTRGKIVSFEGAFPHDAIEFPDAYGNYPAVAAGPTGDFLVAWQDDGIYGHLWGERVYVPLTFRRR